MSELLERVLQLETPEDQWWCGFTEWKLDTSLVTRHDPKTPINEFLATRLSLESAAMRRALARGPGPMPREFMPRSRLPARVQALGDPPAGLWTRGDQGLLGTTTVGIVGSRRPRPDSLTAARVIARQLAGRGVTVVSGLAIGIDGAAHAAAVGAGGPTLAVLACGIDRVHPARHIGLADRIVEGGGLIVSEYGPGLRAYKSRFRDRNRIIAALSDVLVVVQAVHRSGSMITVRAAQELGVDVAVVPSQLGDPAYEGSLALLRDGAHAAVDASAPLRLLGLEAQGAAPSHGFGTLLDIPRTVEDIAALSGLPVAETVRELTDLELDGLVTRTPEGRFLNNGISPVQ